MNRRASPRPALGGALVALALMTTGCGAAASATTPTPPAGRQPSTTAPDERSIVDTTAPGPGREGPLGCGSRLAVHPTPGRFTVTGHFPPSAPAGTGTASGTVDVVSRERLRGVAGQAAEVFLVHDGTVVAVPLPQDAIGVLWDLAPGTPRTLPAAVPLTSCAHEGTALAPGEYQIFARVALVPDGGERMEVLGGPWAFRVSPS